MKKFAEYILVLIFLASCGSTTECCDLPEIPAEVEETEIIKDWTPREEVLVEGSIFTVSYNEVLQQPNWIRYNVRSIEKVVDRDGMEFYEVDSIITSDNDDYYNNPWDCLLYTSPSPRDLSTSRMPSSA